MKFRNAMKKKESNSNLPANTKKKYIFFGIIISLGLIPGKFSELCMQCNMYQVLYFKADSVGSSLFDKNPSLKPPIKWVDENNNNSDNILNPFAVSNTQRRKLLGMFSSLFINFSFLSFFKELMKKLEELAILIS